MYQEHFTGTVRETIQPLLDGLGFSLVELAVGRLKGSPRVSCVIYRPGGVGINECARASELILPRLQTVEGLADVSLEVSSPGIERALRSPSEYGIFTGRGVRVLAGDATEWLSGVIARADGTTLWLRRGPGTVELAISSIRRARLDYAAEVEENKETEEADHAI